ncbi:MAG: hypothetical protein KF730_01965 [Sphingomonas sp.]|uniref:hypothetical protein n=1 Tax=Sphingomonas sp. TaxID=28214 RepID=UPI0025D79F6C|nr:hypothetical protein [Sphingomonas sp.]MBX3563319.1 hypothetical protein [Sphingomonas sp.]
MKTAILLAASGAALCAALPAAAQPYREYDKVEVEDAENPGEWNACTVTKVFKGAYEVSCNYAKSIRRDIQVRLPGREPVAQSAAIPVSGPPFVKDDLVLVSTMGLPDDWKLCVVRRNQVNSLNTYVVACGGSDYNVLPKWVRADPEAPQ